MRNICGYPEIEGDRLYASVDELKRMMDMAGKYGISIDCIAPPFLASSFIDEEKHPAIMLAQSPERDRDIEQLQILIKDSAHACIPRIKYNVSILGILRTGRIPGRGDAMNHAWNLSEAHPATPLTRAGRFPARIFAARAILCLRLGGNCNAARTTHDSSKRIKCVLKHDTRQRPFDHFAHPRRQF